MITSAPRVTARAAFPPAGQNQSRVNRIQQLLVGHVLDDVIEALTDRSGTVHQFPWSPEREVRVGVLAPTITAAPTGTAQPSTGTAGAAVMPPIDNRGVLGLDFVVSGDGGPVQLDIDVSYSLYHPLLPPFARVAGMAAQGAQAAAAANARGRRRRPSVAIQPDWRRDDRRVTLNVTIPVSADEETVSTRVLPGGDPLVGDCATAVTDHYVDPTALRKLAPNQTLPIAAGQGTEADYLNAVNSHLDPNWSPQAPEPEVVISTSPTITGQIAVSVSLRNALVLSERSRVQDLSLYDAKMSVTVLGPHTLEPQQLGFADDDLRYADAATVVGRGRGCVARPGDTTDTIVAETLPIYFAKVAESAVPAGIDVSFGTLAGNYAPTLTALAGEMRSFLRNWAIPPGAGPEEARQLTAMRDHFQAEVERFELGIDALRNDSRLDQAFRAANAAFQAASAARGRGPAAGWRLFQLGFIVSELGALVARENASDPILRHELDFVEVLWFPTGGGKTEAYLGLIIVALFYDRLRGKHRGTTAWLLFPLRMLSVQQLARIVEILHHAEVVRTDTGVGGDPFTLGYLVGSGNTPNRLFYPESNGWWPGMDAFSHLSPAERDDHRLVGACPACRNSNSVGLDADVGDQRLIHVCRSCGFALPIYASDEEITRYQPSVVVSTVDKITAFARNGELTAFHHGPRLGCPQHGWYTHDKCVVPNCKAMGAPVTPTGFLDPVPALWVQDELHLVREDLGVFAAHYHTLIAELAVGAGLLPSKVIAATATIEQYEDQLSQVYGRIPRMFPAGGPTLDRSFYTRSIDDVRRVYLGVLPAGGGTVKVDVVGELQARIIELIHDLSDDPTPLLSTFAADGHNVTAAEARQLLFNYELVLSYVNTKAHGVAILDDLNRLSERLQSQGADIVRSQYLSGETTLSELAATVATIQDDTPKTPRSRRIRGLVGTAVVSHGVDLDRLNFELLAGMPPTYAQYIQATARAGRSFVGLVITAFDRANRRETSVYQSFLTTHAALERMVEPVPVNRFASRAVERTLPGIICALLWDESRSTQHGTTDDIKKTRLFKRWWNSHAPTLVPLLEQRLRRAYSCPVPMPGMASEEAKLVADAADRWTQIERPRMQQWQADWLTDLFTTAAMTSLRDVDVAVEFGAGPKAAQVVERML